MNETIDELLTEALNSEVKAKEFYMQASEKAQSQTGITFFKEMSEFEQEHYEKVKQIIESRNEGVTIDSTWTPNVKQIRSEIEGEFEPNKDEISQVINLAIEAEKNAQDRYQKIAELIDDSEGKTIFTNLANDERNHQKILEDQFYQISNKGTIIWE
jgi:rubrerythrin